MTAFRVIFLRDLKIAFRAGGGAGIGVVFFLALVTIVPFAVGPDLPLLGRIGPAMLASTLSRSSVRPALYSARTAGSRHSRCALV